MFFELATAVTFLLANPRAPMVSDVKTVAFVEFAPLKVRKALPVLGGSIDLDGLFTKYSSEFGVDKNLLTKIADCESHFHQSSVNGDYAGMFQFSSGTWIGTRSQMGLDTNSDLRFSAEESIRTAAFKISRGGVSAWANCAR